MENKIAEINGHKYSRSKFDGYKFRAKFAFGVHGEKTKRILDIYTTDDDNWSVTDVISKLSTSIVENVTPIDFVSKEQDDLTAKFIEETLNMI